VLPENGGVEHQLTLDVCALQIDGSAEGGTSEGQASQDPEVGPKQAGRQAAVNDLRSEQARVLQH
jgi:hypothetical protein